MIRKTAYLTVILISVSACATAPAQIAKVPVPVDCKLKIGADPAPIATYDTLKAQPDIRERLKLALEQLIQDAGRLGEYRAALKAC